MMNYYVCMQTIISETYRSGDSTSATRIFSSVDIHVFQSFGYAFKQEKFIYFIFVPFIAQISTYKSILHFFDSLSMFERGCFYLRPSKVQARLLCQLQVILIKIFPSNLQKYVEGRLHIDLTEVVSRRELNILQKTFGTERNVADISLGNRDECFLEPLNVNSNVKTNRSMRLVMCLQFQMEWEGF